VILLLVGGNPMSEFHRDQFAKIIAGAKRGSPHIWAVSKPHEMLGTQGVPRNDADGTPFSKWAGENPKLGE
jgi:hypothetical protein